jgi:hypothetical protein
MRCQGDRHPGPGRRKEVDRRHVRATPDAKVPPQRAAERRRRCVAEVPKSVTLPALWGAAC